MKIFHIPAFTDNYIWSIEKEGKISVIDPGDANAVVNILQNRNLELEDILITHHHYDHTGGVNELKKVMQGNVYGPDNLAKLSGPYTLPCMTFFSSFTPPV